MFEVFSWYWRRIKNKYVFQAFKPFFINFIPSSEGRATRGKNSPNDKRLECDRQAARPSLKSRNRLLSHKYSYSIRQRYQRNILESFPCVSFPSSSKTPRSPCSYLKWRDAIKHKLKPANKVLPSSPQLLTLWFASFNKSWTSALLWKRHLGLEIIH